MTKSETERTGELNQAEAVENRELVRMVVESSAECTKPFKKLPEAVQAKIIDGMTEVLVEDEMRFRSQWNRKRAEVNDWKRNTLAALHQDFYFNFGLEEDIEETPTGIKLVQLTESLADEFNLSLPGFFDPVRRVFQRSVEALESGFDSFNQTRRYKEKRINSSATNPGHTRKTLLQRSKFTLTGRKI